MFCAGVSSDLAVIAELLHEASNGIAWHLAVGSYVGDRHAGGGVATVFHNLENSGGETLLQRSQCTGLKFKQVKIYEYDSGNSRKWGKEMWQRRTGRRD